MQAAIADRYGPPSVVRIATVAKPVPAEDEILVRIRATTVNSGDARMRALRVPRGLALPVRLRLGLFRLRQPVLGLDLAGEVEAVGRSVTAFRPGDRVLGSPGFAAGCHAEYRCLKASGAVAKIPDGMSCADAVALAFGGMTALHFLAKGGLKPGHRLLVNGASGAVGAMTVQIATHLGASVTGVTSAINAGLVRSLGAADIVDYTAEDVARRPERYDLVMDTVGNLPFARAKRLLGPEGRFLMVIASLGQMLRARFNRRIVDAAAKEHEVFTAAVYRRLLDLAASGAIRPVIDCTLPLARIAEAHALVDSGRKRGAVVITVGEGAR